MMFLIHSLKKGIAAKASDIKPHNLISPVIYKNAGQK
jgi:hypothetical protein